MSIDPNQLYPTYNPNNPNAILPIPDNIKRQFGNYSFSFEEGTKCNFRTKQYNGDYVILINNEAWFDKHIWKLFVNNIKENKNQIVERILLIVEKLWNIPQIEQSIFNTINDFNINFPNTYNLLDKLSISLDVVQTFIYFSWHRCHIEERAYPSVHGFNGRGDYLGATYILFANRYKLQPLNNGLLNPNYSKPEQVYKMATNKRNKTSRELKREGFLNYSSNLSKNRNINL